MSLLLAVEHIDYVLTIFAIGVIAGYLGYMVGSQRDKKQTKVVFNASTYEEETEPPVRQRSRSWSVLEVGTRSKTYHNPQKPCSALKRLRENGTQMDINPCKLCFPDQPLHRRGGQSFVFE